MSDASRIKRLKIAATGAWRERQLLEDNTRIKTLKEDKTVHRRAPVASDMDFGHIRARYSVVVDVWRNASFSREACSDLVETVLEEKNLRITTCMCLGLGSLTTVRESEEFMDSPDESLAQLVDFEFWIDCLREKHHISHVYIQDPTFNHLDESFLKHRGYKILHTPESDDYMSESTFLYSAGVGHDVILSSLKAAFPSVFICDSPLTNHTQWWTPPNLSWEMGYEHRLAAPDKPRRELVGAFLDRYIETTLPTYHGEVRILYYKPDDEDNVGQWKWAVSDEDIYENERLAIKHWQKTGLYNQQNRNANPSDYQGSPTASAGPTDPMNVDMTDTSYANPLNVPYTLSSNTAQNVQEAAARGLRKFEDIHSSNTSQSLQEAIDRGLRNFEDIHSRNTSQSLQEAIDRGLRGFEDIHSSNTSQSLQEAIARGLRKFEDRHR